MNIFNKIKPFYFFLSLFIGFFIVYISNPIPEVIIMHPTPENSNNIVYKGKDERCYKYKSSNLKCPKDKNIIKIIDDNINEEKIPKKNFDLMDYIYNKN